MAVTGIELNRKLNQNSNLSISNSQAHKLFFELHVTKFFEMAESQQNQTVREQRVFNYIQTALQTILLIIIIVLNNLNGDCNTLPPISIGNETIASNATGTAPEAFGYYEQLL